MSNHKEREIRICAYSWPFLVFGMLLIKDRNMMTIFGKQFSRAWRSRCVVLLCLLAVAGGWLWFSRPVTASQQLRGYSVSGVQVIDVVMPSGGPTQLHGIATEDSGEIQELLGLLDQYPTNRKWDWSWLLGEGFGDYNGKDPYSSVWVVLSFRDADGKAGSLQYIVSETGRVQVFEPNRFGDVPAGVGRFGAEGAKQYFAALHRFYEQKVDSPLWVPSTPTEEERSTGVDA